MSTALERTRRGTSPIVVEIVGAPGSGKTSLLPAVEEGLRDGGLHPYGVEQAARPFAARTRLGAMCSPLPEPARGKVLWAAYLAYSYADALAFALVRPALSARVIGSQLGRAPEAHARERRVLFWYVRLAGSYRFLTRRAREREALVLDEGFVHRAVQLHASSVETPRPAEVERYVATLPAPDLVVHVRAPVGTCERRVRERGVWDRFDGASSSELTRFIANAHRATELAIAAARARGWPVIEVANGDTPPAVAAATVRTAVASAVERSAERVEAST
jgi:thymidylate kinase